MSEVVYTHNLEWKSFNIDLNKIKIFLSKYTGFCGISSDINLRLHFTTQLTSDQITEIDNYWQNLTEDSEEASSYVSNKDKAAALVAFKQKLLTKEFQHYTVTDRKILLGEKLDDTDWAVITE